jgi:Beta-lactamase
LFRGTARYSLGWVVSEDKGHQVLGHPGSLAGFLTSFSRIPDVGVTVIVLSNLDGATTLYVKIAEALREAELTGISPTPIDEPAFVEFSDAELAAIVGEYRFDPPSWAATRAKVPSEIAEAWNKLSLSAEGRHLIMGLGGENGPEIHRAVNGMLFLTHLDFRVVAERGDAGLVSAVTFEPTADPGPSRVRYIRSSGR